MGCVAVGAATLLAVTPAHGQDAPMPAFPFGAPVVVLPLQSTLPIDGGGWPGGLASEEETLRTFDAELGFALGERRGAATWALPEAVVRRARRNPLLRIDPTRLAYHVLLSPPDEAEQISEPLHGEMRTLAALFDTRYVLLPVRLEERPADAERPSRPEAGAGQHVAGVLLALVDVRSSRVLWEGEVTGDPAPPGSPLLFASLAARIATRVAPS
jgi:hypothetical protein